MIFPFCEALSLHFQMPSKWGCKNSRQKNNISSVNSGVTKIAGYFVHFGSVPGSATMFFVSSWKTWVNVFVVKFFTSTKLNKTLGILRVIFVLHQKIPIYRDDITSHRISLWSISIASISWKVTRYKCVFSALILFDVRLEKQHPLWGLRCLLKLFFEPRWIHWNKQY